MKTFALPSAFTDIEIRDINPPTLGHFSKLDRKPRKSVEETFANEICYGFIDTLVRNFFLSTPAVGRPAFDLPGFEEPFCERV